jgi:hypothetical protein
MPIDYRFLTIPDGVTKLLFKGFGDHGEILDIIGLIDTQALTAQGRWNRRSGLLIGTSGKWHEWYHLGSVHPATPDDVAKYQNTRAATAARQLWYLARELELACHTLAKDKIYPTGK